MRFLAIDLGTRRIGLALSDESGRFATPLDVLSVNSADEAIAPILKRVESERVDEIVLGLPLNMDGSIGPAAREAIAFGRIIELRSGKPVLFIDERLSSFDAEQTLIERKRAGEKMTRRRKKQRLDAVAAAGFLQAFLDGQLQPINVPD